MIRPGVFSSVARRAWFLAVLAGAGAAVLRGWQPAIVPAPRCPGLLEIAGVALIRAAPTVPIGTLLAWANLLALAAAAAALVGAAHRATGSAMAAVACGIALAVGPAFPDTLAMPDARVAFALAAVAGAWVLADAHVREWRSGLVVAGAAIVVLSVAWPWSAACRGSVPDHVSARVAGIAPWMVASTGPFVLALAAFGAFSRARSGAGARRVGMMAVAAVALAVWWPAAPEVAAAPLLAVVWGLAAAGLADVFGVLPPRAGRWGGAAALAVLLVALQAARTRANVADAGVRGLGHDTLTAQRFGRILDVLPPDAALVEEDASTDLLLQATADRVRAAGKHLAGVPATRTAVRAALPGRSVFALPLARRRLEDRGFRFAPFGASLSRPGSGVPDTVRILARVDSDLPCTTIAATWADVSGPVQGGRFTFVAGAAESRGPVVVYIVSDDRLDAVPDAWPVRATRGFHVRVFERARTNDLHDLDVIARGDGMPAASPVLRHPFVARIVILRTPGAPLALAVRVRGTAVTATARLHPDAAAGQDVVFCPSPDAAFSIPGPPLTGNASGSGKRGHDES